MARRHNLALILVAVGLGVLSARAAYANINVELRLPQEKALVGDVIPVELYTVSDDQGMQPFLAMGVILAWDDSRLELTAYVDNGPYDWLRSFFPNDSRLDGLNEPFDISPGAVPDNDGNAYYEAWTNFDGPAYATPEGLLITTFQFRALATGSTAIEILADFGTDTHTRVLDSVVPGLDVTGLIGPPAQVTIVSCAAPAVEAEGARYVAVTPAASDVPTAIRVTGDSTDPDVSCVWGYVQANGRLALMPLYRTPEEWGTTHVGDAEIVPSATYEIRIECGSGPDTELSQASTATTWLWGDVDNDGDSDVDDLLLVSQASQGTFPEGLTVQNADLAGCTPNGVVDADDLIGAMQAAQGFDFPCPAICLNWDLGAYAACNACLTGPAEEAPVDCDTCDFDGDGDVDLIDFGGFQNVFSGP